MAYMAGFDGVQGPQQQSCAAMQPEPVPATTIKPLHQSCSQFPTCHYHRPETLADRRRPQPDHLPRAASNTTTAMIDHYGYPAAVGCGAVEAGCPSAGTKLRSLTAQCLLRLFSQP